MTEIFIHVRCPDMSSDEAQLRGRFTDIKMQEEEEVNSNH